MDIDATFEASMELAEGSEPSMSTFDNPEMLSEPVMTLYAAMGNAWFDSTLAQMSATARKVVWREIAPDRHT
ncbi:hypothetical protein UB46_35490 [Burkholderiaceae bacterium 16]|nr:hypothetical protein UB46_35490 [Burkholderiaceae bacterium 16]